MMAKSVALIALLAAMLVAITGCTPAASQISAPSTAPAATPEAAPTAPTPPAPTTDTSAPPTTPAPSVSSPQEPVLSSALTHNCSLSSAAPRDFEKVGLAVGKKAINFTLKDINGQEFRLSRLLAEKPVALIFGSFT